MPAEGSGRSGREGLALLRTAISREWLVLIALISRAEAKPAVHRPRLAPGAPGREEQRELLQNFGGLFSFWRGWLLREQGMVGNWEIGGPETGWVQPGWPTPQCPEPASCLQMSQHIFLMSPIKFSPIPPTLGLLSGQKDGGTVCLVGACYPSEFRRRYQEGLPRSVVIGRSAQETPSLGY